jgi:hypothetical protein
VKEGAASVAGIKDFDAQYARALTLVKTDAGSARCSARMSTPTFIIKRPRDRRRATGSLFEAAIQQEISR